VDETNLLAWRERARTTHARQWQRIHKLLEDKLERSVEPKPLRNEDGKEHLDGPNRLVLYSFGFLMTGERRYFQTAWDVAEQVFLSEIHWPPGKPHEASFMTHYAVDNDMSHGHTAINSMALF